jgi:hypothetical protein
VSARADGPQLAIRDVRAEADRVGRFEKIELDLDLTGDWENPYDPDQVDVTAHFTSPSGRRIAVPAFYYQPYRIRQLPSSAKRTRVASLKLYLDEREWEPEPVVTFFLDDVALRVSGTGEQVVLDDMEAGAGDWEPATASASGELAHGGRRSLRFTARVEGEEDWPGAVLACKGADWSRFDGLSLWLYPRMARVRGPVHLYFANDEGVNSPIMQWNPMDLRPNEWNHLVWDWSGFRPDLQAEADGSPTWKVRFTPVEVGRYLCSVTARTPGAEARSEEQAFDVTESSRKGFVRISPDDPHYFVHDRGDVFFPIGHDVVWGSGGPLDLAEAYFPKMAAHGENCTYLIMHGTPWFPQRLAIEWDNLGVYDQEAAALLDRYLALAEQYGIYLKLSFDVHVHNSDLWHLNPYNRARGGPCASPNDFYTDRTAIDLYEKRLRYIVARWAYHPSIMAWESFAEIDGATDLDGSAGWGYPSRPGGERIPALLAPWLRETSAYLRSIDPYQRLITVSFAGDVSDPSIWALPEIEYTQIHTYGALDTAKAVSEWCRKLTAEYPKPMMVTEFGWDAQTVDSGGDRDGVGNHNGLWASVMSGAAGAAMNWWCDRIDELNLYPQYQALAAYVDDVQWPREGFRPAQVELLPAASAALSAVTIQAQGPFAGGSVSEFTVAPDGGVNDPAQVPSFLHAPGRPEPHVDPVFHVDCPAPSSFAVHVHSVSPDARLDIYLDGRLALSQELPAQNVPGKVCTFSEQWQLWQCLYNEEFAIPVPAGRHTIRLANGKPGFSWIRIAGYRLTNYDRDPLRVVGLTGRNTTLLWFQNKESTWGAALRGLVPTPAVGARAIVTGLPPGAYDLEWWDTWSGRVERRETCDAPAGSLELALPVVERDVACKLLRAP